MNVFHYKVSHADCYWDIKTFRDCNKRGNRGHRELIYHLEDRSNYNLMSFVSNISWLKINRGTIFYIFHNIQLKIVRPEASKLVENPKTNKVKCSMSLWSLISKRIYLWFLLLIGVLLFSTNSIFLIHWMEKLTRICPFVDEIVQCGTFVLLQ